VGPARRESVRSCYLETSLPFRAGGKFHWLKFQVHDGESLESALKRFKRKVLQEDIIKEIKRHAFYLKPGQKKRVKEALARKRNRKKRTRTVSQNIERYRGLPRLETRVGAWQHGRLNTATRKPPAPT